MNINLDCFISDVAIALEVNKHEIIGSFELEKSQNWSSLGFISIMSLIDKHFKIYLDYKVVHDCKTFGDLLKLIQKIKIN